MPQRKRTCLLDLYKNGPFPGRARSARGAEGSPSTPQTARAPRKRGRTPIPPQRRPPHCPHHSALFSEKKIRPPPSATLSLFSESETVQMRACQETDFPSFLPTTFEARYHFYPLSFSPIRAHRPCAGCVPAKKPITNRFPSFLPTAFEAGDHFLSFKLFFRMRACRETPFSGPTTFEAARTVFYFNNFFECWMRAC